MTEQIKQITIILFYSIFQSKHRSNEYFSRVLEFIRHVPIENIDESRAIEYIMYIDGFNNKDESSETSDLYNRIRDFQDTYDNARERVKFLRDTSKTMSQICELSTCNNSEILSIYKLIIDYVIAEDLSEDLELSLCRVFSTCCVVFTHDDPSEILDAMFMKTMQKHWETPIHMKVFTEIFEKIIELDLVKQSTRKHIDTSDVEDDRAVNFDQLEIDPTEISSECNTSDLLELE